MGALAARAAKLEMAVPTRTVARRAAAARPEAAGRVPTVAAQRRAAGAVAGRAATAGVVRDAEVTKQPVEGVGMAAAGLAKRAAPPVRVAASKERPMRAHPAAQGEPVASTRGDLPRRSHPYRLAALPR